MRDSQMFGAPSPIPPFEVINQNLQELVRSETILRSVVLELKLDKEIIPSDDVPWYTQWYRISKKYLVGTAGDVWMILKYGKIVSGDPVEGATRGLRKNVSLIDKGSYIFYLVVIDKYPRRASLIVDAIAVKLVDWLSTQQRAPGSRRKQQLGALLEDKSAEIAGYQQEIETILTSNAMVSSVSETEKIIDRLSHMALERVGLEGEVNSVTARLASVREIYAIRESGTRRITRDSGDSLLIQPEDYKKLGSEKLFLTLNLDGLKAKYETLQTSIAELKAKQERIPGIQLQLDYYQIHLNTAKREFNLISDSYQEAVIQATSLDSGAEVLHLANIPTEPIAPIKIYHAGLAAVLSLFIAIGLVYVMDYAKFYLLFGNKPM